MYLDWDIIGQTFDQYGQMGVDRGSFGLLLAKFDGHILIGYDCVSRTLQICYCNKIVGLEYFIN